jgi:hypothetical protein
MDVHVKVYVWDEVRSRSRPAVPLELKYEGPVAVPACGPDEQRRAVQQAVGERHGRRIRGCSSLVGGGYSVIVDPVKAYP